MATKKRKRRMLNEEDILNSDQYRSIIYLTLKYDKGHGLRQRHYRWVLIKNHDGIKYKVTIKKMQEFFKNKQTFLMPDYDVLSDLQKRNIKKGCITSNTNLSNFLKILSNPPYNILIKNTKSNIPSYSLSKKGIFLVLKNHYLNYIHRMSKNDFLGHLENTKIKKWLAPDSFWEKFHV